MCSDRFFRHIMPCFVILDAPSEGQQVVDERVDGWGPIMWILIGTIVVLIMVVALLLILLCKGRRKYIVCELPGKKG